MLLILVYRLLFFITLGVALSYVIRSVAANKRVKPTVIFKLFIFPVLIFIPGSVKKLKQQLSLKEGKKV